MEDIATPGSKRVVRFRTDNFDAYARTLHLTSDTKKAAFIGCGHATFSRIRAGKQNPGPRFIAAVYHACARAGSPSKAADFFDFHGAAA